MLKKLFGWPLQEIRTLLEEESFPMLLQRGLSIEEASDAYDALEGVGAVVEMQATS